MHGARRSAVEVAGRRSMAGTGRRADERSGAGAVEVLAEARRVSGGGGTREKHYWREKGERERRKKGSMGKWGF